MAITITSEPDPQHAAYTFVEFQAETTRDDASSQTINSTIESTSGSRVKFIGDGVSNFEYWDTIIGSGFSDPRLNRKHQVLTVVANTVEVATDWNVDFQGDTGQIDKQNDNLSLRGDVHKFDDNTGASFTTASASQVTNFTRLEGIADTSIFTIGQAVRIKGSTNYDGAHWCINVTPTYIAIETTFIATDSGSIDAGAFVASKRIKSTTGTFTFNFANMLQSVLDFNVASLASTGITNTAPLSAADYTVRMFEEYEVSTGTLEESVTLEHVLPVRYNIFSSIREAHNITRQVDEIVSIDTYLLRTIKKKLLTNQPETVVIGDNEHAQLHFATSDGFTNAVQYQVRKYNSAGSQIGATFTNGPFVLQNNRGIISVESSMWDANTATIQVSVHADPSGASMGQGQKYYIDRKCYVNPVRFHWLNRLGGFDSYTFTADHERSVSTERSMFEQVRTSASTLENRGAGTYNVRAERMFEIFSRFENEETRIWLEELFTSPIVYVEEGTDLIPVVVTLKDQLIDANGLIQHQIQYKLSNSLVLQHG